MNLKLSRCLVGLARLLEVALIPAGALVAHAQFALDPDEEIPLVNVARTVDRFGGVRLGSNGQSLLAVWSRSNSLGSETVAQYVTPSGEPIGVPPLVLDGLSSVPERLVSNGMGYFVVASYCWRLSSGSALKNQIYGAEFNARD